MTRPRPPVRPRLAGGLLLATRQACALLAGRHVSQVRRHCDPVACDVPTRQPLYDADACVAQLATHRRQLVSASLDRESNSGHPLTQ